MVHKMPLGSIKTNSQTPPSSIELNPLSPEGLAQSKSSGTSNFQANELSHTPLAPQGRQAQSVQETSFSKVALKASEGSSAKPIREKAESALLKFKDAGDSTAFKVLDGLFTGSGAGFTQVGKIAKDITGERLLATRSGTEKDAVLVEVAAGVGKSAQSVWNVGTTITYGLSTAANKTNLKDSVANLQVAGDAITGIGGISTAFSGIALIKSSVELTRDIALDATAHTDRQEAQALLKRFDPGTGKFTDPVTGIQVDAEENAQLTKRLQELINKNGGDRTRSAGQTAANYLTKLRDVATSSASVANSVLSVANIAAKATPGLSQALNAVSAAKSTWTAATNIVALNNIQHAAKQAKDDPLLQAIAAHVQQERVYNSRKNLITASVGFAAVGLGIASLAAGPGAPAALAAASIASTAISTAVGLGTTAFELGHAAQLNKRRREGSAEALALFKESITNESLSSADKSHALKALSEPTNIGLAERALIDRLQNGSPEEVKTAVTFLENFGLSKGTISKLKLADTDKALSALQTVLYNDKVSFKLVGLKQSFSTLGKVTGISQFASFVHGKYQQYKLRQKNNGAKPFESLIARSTNSGTKNLIRNLDTQIRKEAHGKVSDTFSQLRDKYLKVPSHPYVAIKREPIQIGANFDVEITWNPKTGRYDDI
jgi:hypothetical protein